MVVGAPLCPQVAPYKVVLLSHGSGATGSALEWLAVKLADAGFIALAVDHHGHTGAEPYRAEGFLCLWERATDLSVIFRHSDWRNLLGGHFAEHAFVVGFSAGAYSALQLLGARVSFSQFESENPEKSPHTGPREFPDLAKMIDPLLKSNEVFRDSWERRRGDFRDAHVRSAVLLAPGRSVRGFDLASLAAIDDTVSLLAGDADTAAPIEVCANWLSQNIKLERFERIKGAGHYVFLPHGTDKGMIAASELFEDISAIDRAKVHNFAADVAIRQFEKE